MSTKRYDSVCARLVQESTGRSYMSCLHDVRAHKAKHPEPMSYTTRALQIVDLIEGGQNAQA